MNALTFAVLLPALLVAHNVGDHWVQSHHQAVTKCAPGWLGRLACARHVATYTATTALTVAGLWWALGLEISLAGFAAGQLVSAVTHYWADRRTTLEWLADLLGRAEFHEFGQPRRGLSAEGVCLRQRADDDRLAVGWDNPCLGTGAYSLDQSWHWAWLGVAALLTAVIP